MGGDSSAPINPTEGAGQEEEFRFFLESGHEILAPLGIDELLETVVRVLGERLPLEYVAIGILAEDDRLVFQAAHPGVLDHADLWRERHEDLWLPLGNTVPGRAAETGEIVVVDDLAVPTDDLPIAWLPRARSELAVPIKSKERVLGVLDIRAAAPGAFGPRDVRRVELMTPLIGVAIEHARALALLEEQNRQLALAEAVSRIAVGAGDLRKLAARVAERLRETLEVDFVGVSVLLPAKGVLELAGGAAAAGVDEIQPAFWPANRGLLGRVMESGCTLVFNAEVEPTREDAVFARSQSEIGIPLRSGGRVVGTLHLASRQPHRFGAQDAQLLEAVSVPLAHALANATAVARLAELRNDLYSMIVHDVRSPVTVILTALSVLERSPGLQQEERTLRYLRNASVAGEEILRLVSSLLDIQKLEAGELTPQPTEFNMADVVRRVVENKRILAEVQEVALSFSSEAELPPVRCDLDLIHRTVENLVGNALKFTPGGGRVEVAVRPATAEELAARLEGRPRAVLVEVRDTGEGIPAEEQLRIFEKFGVVEQRRRRGKASTGLGLALCKLVITAHGGAIWVESEKDRGSRFAFLLPVRE